MDVVVRRLESEFDNEADMPDDYDEYEETKPELDLITVAHVLTKNVEPGEFDCPICYENVTYNKRITISCCHNFCCQCTTQLLKTCNEQQKNVTCPLCRYSCFLLLTPDEDQFREISELLERFEEYNQQIDEQNEMNAFLYYHFTHQLTNEEGFF